MGFIRQTVNGLVKAAAPQSPSFEREKTLRLKKRIAEREESRLRYMQTLEDLRGGIHK